MPIEIKMPALSPTMEEGTLARWLVKPGDTVSAGDLMAEIETDKATMEFEAVDEGTLQSIMVEEGTENVQVGTVIAMLEEEGEDASSPDTAAPPAVAAGGRTAAPGVRKPVEGSRVHLVSSSDTGPNGKITGNNAAAEVGGAGTPNPTPAGPVASAPKQTESGGRVLASPLARRIAEQKGIDLARVVGTGPNGRIVKADVEGAYAGTTQAPAAITTEPKPAPASTVASEDDGAPYEEHKLNNVRKVIARRLSEAKQEVPHIYLTVDVRLDPLLKLRKDLNESLEADGVKLSVNDLIIKALARALQREPQCNVSFRGEMMHHYSRQDISVAVAAPAGLITPIIKDAGRKGLAEISTEMKELAGKARDGRLQPHEYQGGTASLSNLGMFGTKQFDAVINPPQGMILAVGAGEQRPYVLDGALQVATVMTVTGSFDHRAIDGVDGARLLEQFRNLIENPLGLLV